MFWVWMSVGFLAGLVAVSLIAPPLARRWRKREYDRAVRDFRMRRELLEAKFYDLARMQGRPRGLRWIDCDWQSDVRFARDRQTGLLTAFVAVNIQFEAEPGSDMVDVAHVATVRDAAALFHYRAGAWGTGGRALFNMNPNDAVERLSGQYELVK